MHEAMTQIFSTSSGQYYAYEPLTNRIITLHSSLWEGLHPEDAVAGIRAYLTQEGIVPSGGFTQVHWHRPFEQCFRQEIKSLVLQITRRCNLNCSYCVYSGNYRHMLPHADADMTEETIYKAIDFFAEHSTHADDPGISFYGGEALLRFDLIRQAVAYARQKMGDRKFHFSISSNGTMLTANVAAFLEANPDVSVVVTVNGPHHDDHRVMENGQGSLDRIMSNLEQIRKNYPGIWETQIKFIANQTSDLEVPGLREFYQKQLGRLPEIVSAIRDDMANDAIRKILEVDRTAVQSMRERLQAEYVRTADPFLKICFDGPVGLVHDRALYENDSTAYVPSCMPMAGRLFVRWDGTFNLCERVSDGLCTGNVEQGFDSEKIEALYNGFIAFVDRQCRHCWAQRLCAFCYQDVVDANGTLRHQMPAQWCERSKQSILDSLRMYVELAETAPERLSELENRTGMMSHHDVM